MKKLIWILACVMAAFVIACGSPGTDHAAPPEIVSPGQTAPPKAERLIASDFHPSIKVKSKECYGYDIPCNVTYEVKITVDLEKLKRDGRTYEVTYDVKGNKASSQIGTVQIAPDGSYSQFDEVAQTNNSATKLTVSIREIERLPY
jgi:hypothetical protein